MIDDRLSVAFLGLHPGRRRQLADHHGGAAGLLAAVRRGQVDGLDPAAVRSADEARQVLARIGAQAVFLGDPGYPVALAGIADPPDVIFVRGTVPSTPAVAVVGTRRSSGYGRGLARAFGRAVAAAGWVLVSGLARGIDGEAHRGTLEGGGRGVGVLGCGPDVPYPREHRGLIDALTTAGAVVTEYPPGSAPHGWRFPPRNRIISGLSGAVVVVEAGPSGGALVTAARAVEQGREVLAVPGDVDRETSLGCNLLIRDGAIPVLGPDDLVEALSLILGSPPSASRPASGGMIPASGISLDELGIRLGCDGAMLLAWLGRAEMMGQVRRDGDRVYPGGR